MNNTTIIAPGYTPPMFGGFGYGFMPSFMFMPVSIDPSFPESRGSPQAATNPMHCRAQFQSFSLVTGAVRDCVAVETTVLRFDCRKGKARKNFLMLESHSPRFDGFQNSRLHTATSV